MKVALIGGSFDPVHYGHLMMGHQALLQLSVDEVWFIPTKSTPLKERNLTNESDRVNMLRLALKEDNRFKLCTIELERNTTSYTIDTLKELKKRYSHAFYWIIGNDQLEQFHLWRDVDQLVKLAQFVCFDRDGKLVNTNYDVKRLYMPMMPVSSSEIRRGNKLNYLPSEVLNYIYSKRLYVEQFVASRVNEKRFLHSVSVASLCEEFAQNNGLDKDVAYYIGLFHDIAKSMPNERMAPWMEIICPDKMDYAVPVWHGFVGSEIVDRIFYLHDERIKHAIYHHVLGTSTDPYAMMVFCADKLDPLRGYDSSELISLCEHDLYQGFLRVKEENEKYLRKGK